jgi:hypothetical protein
MTLAKIIFIYTALGVFVAIAATGILSAFGAINLPRASITTAFIGPCLGIVAAVLNAKHLFDDPDAIKKLREEHAEFVARLKEQHLEEILRLKQENADTKLRLNTAMSQAEAQHQKTEAELREQIARIEIGRFLKH